MYFLVTEGKAGGSQVTTRVNFSSSADRGLSFTMLKFTFLESMFKRKNGMKERRKGRKVRIKERIGTR